MLLYEHVILSKQKDLELGKYRIDVIKEAYHGCCLCCKHVLQRYVHLECIMGNSPDRDRCCVYRTAYHATESVISTFVWKGFKKGYRPVSRTLISHRESSGFVRRKQQLKFKLLKLYCIRKKWISQSLKEVQTGIYAQRRCVHTLVIDIENAGIFSMPA